MSEPTDELPPPTPGITFQQVTHRFGDRTVVDAIDLSLTERRIGIVGANGSGKSTLVRMINGLVTPTAGTITVDGLNVHKHGRDVRKKVGFVFTDPDNQIVMPTVAEDVAFSLRRLGLSKADIDTRVTAMVEHVGLTSHRDHPAHLLSGGQKQMLALASVLVRTPAIIVADEPTTLLDLRNTRRLAQMFEQLDQQVVVVSHDLEFLRGFDRIIVIDSGRVAADGAPDVTLPFYRNLVT